MVSLYVLEGLGFRVDSADAIPVRSFEDLPHPKNSLSHNSL